MFKFVSSEPHVRTTYNLDEIGALKSFVASVAEVGKVPAIALATNGQARKRSGSPRMGCRR